MVKVSVIVPVYNAEQYLEKCLNSICSQTLKEIEIICVNDGSTDGSLQMLHEFAERDRRIKIVSQSNQYAGVARNHGMEYATGKYLSFLDADDYFKHDMLEKMYQRAEKSRADIVICRYIEYNEQLKKVMPMDWAFIDSFFIDKEEFSGNSLKNAGVFQITRGWAWDKLFRTDFVNQCGYRFPDFRSSEDGFFVYMLLARANKIIYMDDILITHIMNELNSLSSTKEQNWINGFKMLLMIKEEMEKLDIYEMYKQSFLNEVVNFLVWYLDSMHSFDAYGNCYQYIRTEMELAANVLSYGKEYYFKGDLYDRYQKIIMLPLDEFLFIEKERYWNSEAGKNCVIERQKKIIEEKKWFFPFNSIEKGKIIVLYGAGKLGRDYYSQLVASQFCKKVIWVDRQYIKYTDMGVQRPEAIFQQKFDYIFIAVKNKEVQEEIKLWLKEQGVGIEKIKYENTNCICDR